MQRLFFFRDTKEEEAGGLEHELLALVAQHLLPAPRGGAVAALSRLAGACRGGARVARALLAALKAPHLRWRAAARLCARLGLADGGRYYRRGRDESGCVFDWGLCVRIAPRTGRIVLRERAVVVSNTAGDSRRMYTVVSPADGRVAQLMRPLLLLPSPSGVDSGADEEAPMRHMLWKQWDDERELSDFIAFYTLIGRMLWGGERRRALAQYIAPHPLRIHARGMHVVLHELAPGATTTMFGAAPSSDDSE